MVSALNSEVLYYVRHHCEKSPNHCPYKALKDHLIAEFSNSERKQLTDLLMHTVLGDKTPSHLLWKMRQLTKVKIGEEFFLNISYNV